MPSVKKRAPRNRTLTLSAADGKRLAGKLRTPGNAKLSVPELTDSVFCGDFFRILPLLPDSFADLVVLDPPYNLAKDFNGLHFSEQDPDSYESWLDSWFAPMMRLLKPGASVYLCCDWRSSAPCFRVMRRHLTVRNRITWEREKGRGALSNWKNCSEDIWFGTLGNNYCFNPDSVKLKRRVRAPYREKGLPKDWLETPAGNFRLTFPSNFWDDISIPYWSMPENTDHPTQKPEKLLAKLILASSNPGDLVFDPFLGSGTTAAAAKKLERRFCGIELDREYCCWAEARLERAETDKSIQGLSDGVFWERNSVPERQKNHILSGKSGI